MHLDASHFTRLRCLSDLASLSEQASAAMNLYMAGRFNIYLQLVISAIRIADINNSNQTSLLTTHTHTHTRLTTLFPERVTVECTCLLHIGTP